MREPALHSTPGGQRSLMHQRGCYSGHRSRLRFPSTSCQVSGSGWLRRACPAQDSYAPRHIWPQALLQMATHTQYTPKVEWPQAKPSQSRCRTPGQSGQVGMSRSILWGTGRASKREPRGRGARRGSSGKFRDQGCVRPRTTHTLGGSRAPPEPGQGWGALWLGSLVLGLL